MKRSTVLARKLRNLYVYYLLEVLTDKYFINKSGITDNLGWSSTEVQNLDRRNGRWMTEERLDILEGLIIEKYEPLLEGEVPDSYSGMVEVALATAKSLGLDMEEFYA